MNVRILKLKRKIFLTVRIRPFMKAYSSKRTFFEFSWLCMDLGMTPFVLFQQSLILMKKSPRTIWGLWAEIPLLIDSSGCLAVSFPLQHFISL